MPAKKSAAKKTAAKKTAAKKTAAKKTAAKKTAAKSSPTQKPPTKTAKVSATTAKAAKAVKTAPKVAKKAAVRPTRRADFLGPADDYFAALPDDKRAMLEALRALVIAEVPQAATVIKWGVPFFEIQGNKVCALAAFKNHVVLNLFGPPEVFVDPAGRLEGTGASNRSLKITVPDQIDAKQIRAWLKAAASAQS